MNNGAPGAGLTFEIIKPGGFLQLFFQRIGQQSGGIRYGCPGPLRRNNGRFNRKRRIFVTWQVLITERAHSNDQQHEETDHLLMI